jgi:nicotinate-nucleotide adenylyltransferase
MNVVLYGGTFDPIHCGHLSAAATARDSLSLDRIYFIPAARPPHRMRARLTAFEHRYAMVALACEGRPEFIPSPMEALGARGPSYSIRTVRRFRGGLATGDRLFFLIGADAFLEFRSWYRWRALLDAAEFLIVSRPGFPLAKVEQVLPQDEVVQRRRHVLAGRTVREFRLPRLSAWLLTGLSEPVSATAIRRRAAAGKPLSGLVPPAVAEYIAKQRLYRAPSQAEQELKECPQH